MSTTTAAIKTLREPSSRPLMGGTFRSSFDSSKATWAAKADWAVELVEDIFIPLLTRRPLKSTSSHSSTVAMRKPKARSWNWPAFAAVSYTHLTLPTIA